MKLNHSTMARLGYYLIVLACSLLPIHALHAASIDSDVIVKFATDTGFAIEEPITIQKGVIFTSAADDAVGGKLLPDAQEAVAGSWKGIQMSSYIEERTVSLMDSLSIRYADTGIVLSDKKQIKGLVVEHCKVGVQANGGQITNALLTNNKIGITTDSNHSLSVQNSSIYQNTEFGIQNQGNKNISASRVWWGDATGPYHISTNPSGLGNAISDAVSASSPSNRQSLYNCSAELISDSYQVYQPTIQLKLYCPAAAKVRVSTSIDFAESVFVPMANHLEYTLPSSDSAPLYIEFRNAADGDGTIIKTRPVDYYPDRPVVKLVAPIANTTINKDADLLIAADIRAAQPVEQVTFYVDGVQIGEVRQAPYIWRWQAADLAYGAHQIRVEARHANGKTDADIIQIQVGTAANQTTLLKATFNGTELSDGLVIANSGYLVFNLNHPIGSVSAASVMLGDQRKLGSLFGHYYVVPLTDVPSGAQTLSYGSQTWNLSFDSPPRLSFVLPQENATITGTSEIILLSQDAANIEHVKVYIDDTLLDTLTESPYITTWRLGEIEDGEHVIKAVATTHAGKTAEVSRTVNVFQHIIGKMLPYYTEITSTTPVKSFGDESIVITGVVKDSVTDELVANASLQMKLKIGSFERTVNLASNSEGSFSFTYRPAYGDRGLYLFQITHPDQNTFVEQGRFEIVNIATTTTWNIKGIYGHPTTVQLPLRSEGGALSNITVHARAEDQEQLQLPAGVAIELGESKSTTGDQTVKIPLTLTPSQSTDANGSFWLVVTAAESGDRILAKIKVNYRWSDAQAWLEPSTNLIKTGTRPDESVDEVFSMKNKGMAAAVNVKAQLVQYSNHAKPDWITLVGNGQLGQIAVGETSKVQIHAAPPAGTADGYYYANLKITADNHASGNTTVQVMVTRSETGSLKVHVSDIYTQTLNDQGEPILGLKDANIRIQHLVDSSVTQSGKTDANGEMLLENVKVGRYRLTASATDHSSVQAEILIRPGITNEKEVFLDNTLITVSWSVTETTIDDVYDILLDLVFQTEVPAPVIVIEPAIINLPLMQAGEVITGEMTVTNYGMIAAHNLVSRPPQEDEYFSFEYGVTVPETLGARTQIRIPYTITAKQPWTAQLLRQPSTFQLFPTAYANSCSNYGNSFTVEGTFECASGSERPIHAQQQISGRYGSSCGQGSSGGSTSWGAGGWDWSGWGGGTGGGGSEYVPLADDCAPDCKGCNGQCGAVGSCLTPSLCQGERCKPDCQGDECKPCTGDDCECKNK